MGLLFTFWAAAVFPLFAGIFTLVTSILGCSHTSSDYDLRHNNCCCHPKTARMHLTHMQIAVFALNIVSFLCAVAGIAMARQRTPEEHADLYLVFAVFCLFVSFAIVAVALKGFSWMRKLRRLTDDTDAVVMPAVAYRDMSSDRRPVDPPIPPPGSADGQFQGPPPRQQESPSYDYQDSTPVVVGRVVSVPSNPQEDRRY